MADKERWDGWLGPKQWMPIVGILSVAIVALAVVLVMNMGDDEDTPGATGGAGRVPTHEHADFAVFIRGEQFDFSPYMFGEDDTPESNNVHLHDPRPNVVHVHTTLTTWDEFFTSIGFTLTDPSFPGITEDRTCFELPDGTEHCSTDADKWKFVVNGVPVDGIANMNIGDLSRVVLSYGPESAEDVLVQQYSQVTNNACILSELCIARIDPNEPREACQGVGVCNK
jgi:hypothetical protein